MNKTQSRDLDKGKVAFVGAPIFLKGESIGVLNVDCLFGEEISDCRNVLVSGIGEAPVHCWTVMGVEPLEVTGSIEEALRFIYTGDDLLAMRVRKAKVCSV
ncbi:hypothetical protein [Dethiosulfatarculus sandiegensis]|uniref:GAF domain-containing protein n=1 Tax=Dethiosulfatarculus sandiegensis TaxID=1429043 RepID=A0A0D2JAB1_9BACT|nr:hypothetical protein [Dethiosulfatarculus sandiegensis]KIX12671.1 hypothetical protein X474_17970 [Dethiosulfatarculus sandiegensis]